MQQPRVTFETGVGTVTGSNFLIETAAGAKILVDCGMVQGSKVALDVNSEPFAYDPASIRALLVTHAHLDHVGRIPKLVRGGFSGPIYSTPETRELAKIVLEDAVGIVAEEAREYGREPLFGADDVARALPLWKDVPYHQPFSPASGATATFKDAGHILGSAMIELSLEGGDGAAETKILFTGDLGNSPAPLLCDTEPAGDVDYIAIESTYGDRNHEPADERSAKLESIVKDAVAKGGTLVIPSFAIDRTQVILYELNNMVEKGRIPSIPIFVDSPMAIKATEIYKRHEELFNDRVREQIRRGDDIFSFPKLEYVMSNGESRRIESVPGAKIILAGSGMSVGGRIVSHEERHLSDPASTLLLVGYQSAGSLGRELADGAKKVRIHGRDVKVRARVETIYGYSAHKDSDHLVGFVGTATRRLKKVFVILGEPRSSMHLAQRLNGELGADALVPEQGTAYELMGSRSEGGGR